jgi:DNA-binding GntR family transcriptional regulator
MKSTTSDHTYHGIRQVLARGEFRPGQRVSPSKLARRWGRNTVPDVEAMRRLESGGLLVKQARKMAKVREQSAADLCCCVVNCEMAARRIDRALDQQRINAAA